MSIRVYRSGPPSPASHAWTILRHRAQERMRVASAGEVPHGQVNPFGVPSFGTYLPSAIPSKIKHVASAVFDGRLRTATQ
jgi:hypothetical protein